MSDIKVSTQTQSLSLVTSTSIRGTNEVKLFEIPKSTKQIVLISVPIGIPNQSNFSYRDTLIRELVDGEFLVRIHYLSIDPYIRAFAMGPKDIGKVITCYGVGDIIATKSSNWPVGAYVTGISGATEYYISDGTSNGAMEGHGWRIVDISLGAISTSIGVLGMPGATAWLSLRDYVSFPKGGIVVISAAAGAVGNLFGQLAKLKGAGKVIGLAGTTEKCATLLTRGFDIAINYKTDDVAAALRVAAPDGIDHYFDNVGGSLKTIVYLQLKAGGTSCWCGNIDQYNNIGSDGIMPSYVNDEQKLIIDSKNITTTRPFALNIFDKWHEAFTAMSPLIKNGTLKYDEHFVDGLDQFVASLIAQLGGANTGKMNIRLSPVTGVPSASVQPIISGTTATATIVKA